MSRKARSIKASTIAVAVIFTISVSGYFIGLRQTLRGLPAAEAVVPPMNVSGTHAAVQVLPAPDYSAIADTDFGPNAHFKSHLKDLRESPHSAGRAARIAASPAGLHAQRAARRAYDGAPPIVPHPIAQKNTASCLACHRKATVIGDVVAPAISHPAYTSCTQCHVTAKGLGSRWDTSPIDLHTGNQFAGDHREKPGEKAYPDAPQTIPHPLHMRQNCLSCHGELGTSPIRTSHPERQSCTQCHVPASNIDKRSFSESPFPLIETLLQKKQ